MLKIKVKVGKITNLSEARYCAGMGVDMLGFSIGGDIITLDPVKFKEITAWVSGPELVIEWVSDIIPHNLATILQTYNARLVQVDASHLKNIPDLGVKWIISMDILDWSAYKSEVIRKRDALAYVILRAPGKLPLWREVVNEIAALVPALLEDIDDDLLDSLIDLPVAGLSLHGTDESRPGLKEYELSRILERLDE